MSLLNLLTLLRIGEGGKRPSLQVLFLQTLFQNTFILKRPTVAIFADIIKIVIVFITTIFKDSKKKVKIIRNYVSKRSLYLYFLILLKFAYF